MQAFWSRTLTLWIIVSFSAIGAAAGEEAAELRVAAFRCDITPASCKIYDRPVATIEHPLWAKGAVLDDGDRYVLCALDWRSL